MAVYDETLTDAVDVSQPENVGSYGPVVTDGVRPSGVLSVIRAQLPEATDNVDISSALSVLVGLRLAETLSIAQTHIPNHKFNLTLTEEAEIAEALVCGYPVELSQALTITASEIVQRAISVIEALEITDTITPILTYHLSLSDSLEAADALARFLGADATDSLTVSSVLTGVAGMGGQLSEEITIAETLTPMFMLRVIVSDEIEFDDADVVRMVFNGELTEAIELAAAYVSPGDSITTWVMNTRTAAVSEYQNYAFNSFARVGNRYLGATQEGLYELLGDDDEGTDIVATIRSGFAQWAGTHLGSFKAAYIAVRGEGDFVLRVISGDGRTYNYTVTVESMKTTKVNMGKGLRARYFAFELVSTGQDFDLDTLEFIPLVADRRV